MTPVKRLSEMSDNDFNAYTARVNAAMAHYHAHYNNDTYQAIQKSVVCDLCGAYQAHEPKLLERALNLPEINALLNLVTDGALEISGHPDMEGQCARLLRSVMSWPISEETVQAIAMHWKNFETTGQVFSAEFALAAGAVLRLRILTEDVNALVQMTSDIRGVSGNAAHGLTRAAYRLLRAAQLLLSSEPSRAYIEEQIQAAERHLADSRLFLTKPHQAILEKSPLTDDSVQPYRTLVLSSDGTYPGIVTAITERFAHVTWHKWGYKGETFHEGMLLSHVEAQRLSIEECRKRFGGLPPLYRA
jgi:hypothetical protein